MKKELEKLIDARDETEAAMDTLLAPITEWLKKRYRGHSYIHTETISYGTDNLSLDYCDGYDEHNDILIPWKFLEDGFDSEGFENLLREQIEEAKAALKLKNIQATKDTIERLQKQLDEQTEGSQVW